MDVGGPSLLVGMSGGTSVDLGTSSIFNILALLLTVSSHVSPELSLFSDFLWMDVLLYLMR